LIVTLQPSASVKSSSLFRKYLCPLVFDQIHAIVEKTLVEDIQLSNVDGFAFTTDHWTSRSGECYQSLTLHYIDVDFQMKKVNRLD